MKKDKGFVRLRSIKVRRYVNEGEPPAASRVLSPMVSPFLPLLNTRITSL